MPWYTQVLGMFDKIDDIVFLPVKVVTDWAGEPLRSWEHDRELAKDRQKVELQIKLEESSTNLQIKRETEVVRVLTEIKEWRKDKELQRLERATEAMMKLQERLTHINFESIEALGNLHLTMQHRAYKLVHETTLKYKALQDQAMSDAINDLKRIEEEIKSEAAKDILLKAVDKKLANIIDRADAFIQQLNKDIEQLNTSIDLLLSSGQKFMEKNLASFRALGFSDDSELSQIEGSVEPKKLQGSSGED